MSVIEKGLNDELGNKETVEEDKDCDCGSYDCDKCFPDTKEGCDEAAIEENEVYDAVYDLAEGDDEYDVFEADYFDEDADCDGENEDGEESPLSCSPIAEDDDEMEEVPAEDDPEVYDLDDEDPDAMVDIDMDDVASTDRAAPDMDLDIEPASARDASDEMSGVIGAILHMQDLGLGGDKYYDMDDLVGMSPKLLKRIHDRMVMSNEGMYEGEKADKDYDGDGEIESSEDEWKGSRDKAIKKSMNESADPDVLKVLKALNG
jgi:hypothetical protein